MNPICQMSVQWPNIYYLDLILFPRWYLLWVLWEYVAFHTLAPVGAYPAHQLFSFPLCDCPGRVTWSQMISQRMSLLDAPFSHHVSRSFLCNLWPCPLKTSWRWLSWGILGDPVSHSGNWQFQYNIHHCHCIPCLNKDLVENKFLFTKEHYVINQCHLGLLANTFSQTFIIMCYYILEKTLHANKFPYLEYNEEQDWDCCQRYLEEIWSVLVLYSLASCLYLV